MTDPGSISKSDRKPLPHEDFANESIYHIWIKLCAILWGAAMYSASEPDMPSGVRNLLIVVISLSILLIVFWLLDKASGGRKAQKRMYSLGRPMKVILGDILWKIGSYGLIALVPRLALPFKQTSVLEAINNHDVLLSAVIVHLLVSVLTVVFLLRPEAKKERGES
jgi:cbb3-type cytochrome oxidase subunit 3